MGKKPRTLLIWPPLSGRMEAQVHMTMEPLGLAYLAAVLEANGYEVKILDALALGNEQRESLGDGIVRVGLSEKQIKESIGEYVPDIVGIGCMFSGQETDHLRVAKFAKDVCPKALVVCGGAHASVSPESLMRDDNVDLVVRGEGETTFLELLKCLEQGGEFLHLTGTVTRNGNGTLLFNPPRELIGDLDTLPFPARHLLPMEKYFEFQRSGQVMYRYYLRKPIASIVSSRGCLFNCVFCAVHLVWGRSWRGRSPENVIGELKFLTKKYGIKEFSPWDDNIAYDKKRLIGICDGILDAGLNVRWATPNGIYLWKLDEEVLTRMKRSGYYRAAFGVESGDPRTLKLIGKPADFEKAKHIIKICNRLGIWTASTFVIGFPDEDLESINRTINIASELGLDFAFFYVAQPHMGTRLRTLFEQEGLLNPREIKESSGLFSTYDTKRFTGKQLMQFQQLAYRRFIRRRIIRALNPLNMGQIIYKINSPEKFLYFLRLINNLQLGVWMGRVAPASFSRKIARKWRRVRPIAKEA